MLTPILSSISVVVRGTEQTLTMSLCLLDNDTFGVSECLSRVSKSVPEVSKSVPECLSRVSKSLSEVFKSVPECLSRVSWSVSECLSPVLWSSTWLPSPLQTVMTNSCALSLFINVTLTSSSRARVIPLPTPVYGSKYIALLKRNILRGIEVPALMSSIVSPLGNAPGL